MTAHRPGFGSTLALAGAHEEALRISNEMSGPHCEFGCAYCAEVADEMFYAWLHGEYIRHGYKIEHKT